MFIVKCGGLDMYDKDLEKTFTIGFEQLQFDKNAGWNLFRICDKPDRYLYGHETFCIHDDIFDRIQ